MYRRTRLQLAQKNGMPCNTIIDTCGRDFSNDIPTSPVCFGLDKARLVTTSRSRVLSIFMVVPSDFSLSYAEGADRVLSRFAMAS